MPTIPVHGLPPQLPVPFALMRLAGAQQPSSPDALAVHRHSHYSFLLYESGSATALMDLQPVHFGAGSIYYMLPGQVHQRQHEHDIQGWFLEVAVGLIPHKFRQVLEGRLALQAPQTLPAAQLAQCQRLLSLLHERSSANGSFPFAPHVTTALVQAVSGVFAGAYAQSSPVGVAASRAQELTYRFRILLEQHFATLKSPAAYARQLHVSPNHLNAMVKRETGFSVSYWIGHAIVLEAKRLLVYSTLEVKEIAALLGYTDGPYFCRLFKKQVGLSPGAFRRQTP